MHHFIERMAAVAALSICMLAGSAALAQGPPEPPPPDRQQQSPRDVEQTERTERTERRREARRHAAAGQAVRQRKRGISPIRYGLGGLVGTFYGFGIGHAIVGEWTNKGWFFTVGEFGAVGLAAYGLTQSFSRDASAASARRGEMFTVVGVLAFTVLRVYEVVDVWTRPTVAAVDRPADAAFAVGPVGPDGGLGALFQLRW